MFHKKTSYLISISYHIHLISISYPSHIHLISISYPSHIHIISTVFILNPSVFWGIRRIINFHVTQKKTSYLISIFYVHRFIRFFHPVPHRQSRSFSMPSSIFRRLASNSWDLASRENILCTYAIHIIYIYIIYIYTYIRVNYNNSLTWMVRPFGDDSPY